MLQIYIINLYESRARKQESRKSNANIGISVGFRLKFS
jgi:GR25 family glycosyltransferase involved in LPS biosynthesis